MAMGPRFLTPSQWRRQDFLLEGQNGAEKISLGQRPLPWLQMRPMPLSLTEMEFKRVF